MLQRNLLYTAVTRGKRLVVIVGQKKAMAIVVKGKQTALVEAERMAGGRPVVVRHGCLLSTPAVGFGCLVAGAAAPPFLRGGAGSPDRHREVAAAPRFARMHPSAIERRLPK
jgi:hypothetical protein